jgi:hypothetical protein
VSGDVDETIGSDVAGALLADERAVGAVIEGVMRSLEHAATAPAMSTRRMAPCRRREGDCPSRKGIVESHRWGVQIALLGMTIRSMSLTDTARFFAHLRR